jgi:hypothetical protein
VAAGANTHIKGFADACYKGEEGVAEGVALKGITAEDITYYKDEKSKQKREEVIASLIKVKLRRLWRDTIIISLSLTSVFVSLSFV